MQSFDFDNRLLEKITETYRSWYAAGLEPTEKSFVYHDDKEMSAMVISLIEFPYELSPNWEKRFEGMKVIKANAEADETADSLKYFKLRKIKEMLTENQKELAHSADMQEQIRLINVHRELKDVEREITGQLGTVILK